MNHKYLVGTPFVWISASVQLGMEAISLRFLEAQVAAACGDTWSLLPENQTLDYKAAV